jgi:phosphonate transport system substrate-binding protein
MRITLRLLDFFLIAKQGILKQGMLKRRSFLGLLFLSGCTLGSQSIRGEELVIGTVSYGTGEDTITRYDRFEQYIEEKMRAFVTLEPAYNESKALERIKANAWALIFAPPGLAVIAITRYQYTPMFPLLGTSNLRSVVVVKKESPHEDLKALTGKSFAIGQPGSATGYYFPIYNLYGLTLSELVVCPTPKAVLEAIAQDKAEAGALSMEEFSALRPDLKPTEFRVLFTDPHKVPPGVVLISPSVDLNLQESLRRTMADMPSQVTNDAGFLPAGEVPDYKYMISVVERVRSIFPADQSQGGKSPLEQKPVRLFPS